MIPTDESPADRNTIVEREGVEGLRPYYALMRGHSKDEWIRLERRADDLSDKSLVAELEEMR